MSQRQYSAFISYSSKDEKYAKWLHKSLEAYRTPGHLINTDGRDGKVPKKLKPVFRDRDELPTSADLGGVIQAALEASDYLIVICSPNSAKSRWVGEEIKSFKKMGKANRILCLIIGGEPNATDEGRVEEECFPAPLRFKVLPDGSLSEQREEPIAADFHKDGKERSKLKLLAGLLGVDFDKLFGREKRRKQQRRLFGSIAGLLVIAGMIYYWQYLQLVEQQKLLEESQNLTQQADKALQSGDRTQALELALAALPTNYSDPERPYLREAEVMLYKAVASYEETKIIDAHNGAITQVAADEQANYLLTTSNDTKVKFWDVDSGVLIKTFVDHTSNIIELSISADGRLAASVDEEGNIFVWDLEKRSKKYHLLFGRLYSKLSFSSDNRYLVVDGWRGAALFDLTDGSDLSKTLVGEERYPDNIILGNNNKTVIYSIAGELVKTSLDNLAAKQRLKLYEDFQDNYGSARSIAGLQFSKNNQFIISYLETETKLINFETFTQIAHYKDFGLNSATDIRLTENEATIVFNNNQKVWKFDLATGNKEQILEDYRPFGASMLYNSDDNSFIFYDHQSINYYLQDNKVPVFTLSPPAAATGSIYNVPKVELIKPAKTDLLIFAGSDGRVRFYNVGKQSQAPLTKLPGPINNWITNPVKPSEIAISGQDYFSIIDSQEEAEQAVASTEAEANTVLSKTIATTQAISHMAYTLNGEDLIFATEFGLIGIAPAAQPEDLSIEQLLYSDNDRTLGIEVSENSKVISIDTLQQGELRFNASSRPLEFVPWSQEQLVNFVYNRPSDSWISETTTGFIKKGFAGQPITLPAQLNPLRFEDNIFSWDKNRALLNFNNHALGLLDLDDGTLLARYQVSSGSSGLSDMTDDGRLVFMGKYSDVLIYESRSGTPIQSLSFQSRSDGYKSFRDIAFLSDSQELLVLEEFVDQQNLDKTLIYHTNYQRDGVLWQVELEQQDLNHLANNNDVVLIHSKQNWLLYDRKTGQLINKIEWSEQLSPSLISLSQNERFVSVYVNNEYRVYEVNTLKKIGRFESSYSRGRASVSNNGSYLLIVGRQSLTVIDVSSGKKIGSLVGDYSFVKFDTEQVVQVFSNNGWYCLWDFSKNPSVFARDRIDGLSECQQTLINQTIPLDYGEVMYQQHHRVSITDNTISENFKDNSSITDIDFSLSFTIPPITKESEIFVYLDQAEGFVAYNILERKEIATFLPENGLKQMISDPTGQNIVIENSNNELTLWQPSTKSNVFQPISLPQSLLTFRLSKNGQLLVGIDRDNNLIMFDLKQQKLINSKKVEVDFSAFNLVDLTIKHLENTNRVLLLLSSGTAYIWDVQAQSFNDFAISQTNNYWINDTETRLVIKNYDGLVIYDLASFELIYENKEYDFVVASPSAHYIIQNHSTGFDVIRVKDGEVVYQHKSENYYANQYSFNVLVDDVSNKLFVPVSDNISHIYKLNVIDLLTGDLINSAATSVSIPKLVLGKHTVRARVNQNLHWQYDLSNKQQLIGIGNVRPEFLFYTKSVIPKLKEIYADYVVHNYSAKKSTIIGNPIAFLTRNRQLLLIQTADNRISIVDPYQNQIKAIIQGIDGTLSDVFISDKIVFTVSNKGVVQSWSLDSGDMLNNYGTMVFNTGFGSSPYKISVGKQFGVVFSESQLILWDLATGSILDVTNFQRKLLEAKLAADEASIFLLFQEGSYRIIPVMGFGSYLIDKAKALIGIKTAIQ